MTARRTAILISGRGSNMRALVEAAKAPGFPARIDLVLSNRADAAGLDFAAAEGISTHVLDHKQFRDRHTFDEALHRVLVDHGIELVCLAGFMRLLGGDFVSIWQDRMINIHPSLLPAFKGLHTHERVLEAGVRITGCTVHFVRPEMDAGPIIAQAAVPVAPGDTADTLADRVLAAEHATYPKALAIVASGRFSIEGDRVSTDLPVDPALGLFVP
ncbi:MAG: phosphoribosylglycinamide formyltransferase [Rhodobiaceae bacterium]|nr:phosphoribosylglycinamide formyltransferase [Rhodobiaceae bacterium]